MGENVFKLKKDKKRHYWEQRIRDWKESGLKQTQYCRQNNLNIRNFGYWKKCFYRTSSTLSFIPLQIQPDIFQKKSSSLLNVVLEGDRKIEVAEDFDPVILKKLINTLEEI